VTNFATIANLLPKKPNARRQNHRIFGNLKTFFAFGTQRSQVQILSPRFVFYGVFTDLLHWKRHRLLPFCDQSLFARL